MPSQILPRARFVDHLVAKPDPADQLAALVDGALDLATTAVVGHIPSLLVAPPIAKPPGTAPVPDAEVLAYQPERIEVAVRTDRPRLLVFSELDYPGWRAEVDGRPVPLITTNFVFRGVVVPAGATRVVLEFEPLSLVIGGAISVGALGFVALVLYRASQAPAQGRGKAVGRSATT
jgi:hypothetical protein